MSEFMDAVRAGKADRVKALISAGADVNETFVCNTVLMVAAEGGHLEVVKALIAAGADVNEQQKLYCRLTALMIAAERGHGDIVAVLIAAGADVNARDHINQTVLMRAKRSVKGILRAAGAKRIINWGDIGVWVGIVLIGSLLLLGSAALARWILRPFPIWAAVLVGIAVVLGIVICLAFISDESGKSRRTLLGWITFTPCVVVGLHLHYPSLPIWAAALSGILAAPILASLTLLLPEGLPSRAKINAKDHLDETPLMKAAQKGELRRLKALIAAGADVNAQEDRFGRETALMKAADKGHAECVKALIAAGADLNAKNQRGETALAQNRYKSNIAAILEAAADIPLRRENKPALGETSQAEARNLIRWEQSGYARKWVDDHHRQWNNSDWLDLLENLKRSEFWPMKPDAIGQVLEKCKKEQPQPQLGSSSNRLAEHTEIQKEFRKLYCEIAAELSLGEAMKEYKMSVEQNFACKWEYISKRLQHKYSLSDQDIEQLFVDFYEKYEQNWGMKRIGK